MTDEIRPAWGPPPVVETHTDEPARPSWDSLPALVRRTVDLKLIIAVLIGLVSVTGAVVAFRSAIAGEKATDKDRQAVAESVVVAQAAASNEIVVQDARVRFADHLAAEVAATQLQARAEQLRGSGDAGGAAAAEAEAVEQRTIARRALEGGSAPVLIAGYVSVGDDGIPVFDEAGFRSDVDDFTTNRDQVDPSQTVRDANRLRADSQRLDGWLIAMVGAVVVLTLAQINRHRPVRIALLGAGAVIWLASSAMAFGGS
jgi:hypothetical protein